MYDDVVGEDVPDEFLSFLEKADERLSGDGEKQDDKRPDEKPKR